jgi:hypothetical protein
LRIRGRKEEFSFLGLQENNFLEPPVGNKQIEPNE